MNSVPKLFSCSYADCWTEKHFSTEFGVLTPNHTHLHTLFWGCVSRWSGERLHGMQEVTSSTLVFSTTPVRMDTSPSLFFYRNPSPASTNIPLYHPAATGRRLGAAPSGYGQNREQARPGQKKRQSAAKKTQSPVIQDNDRQRTRLLKKISALYRHYREHRF